MRLSVLLVALAAVGCGGTSFYDVQGGAPEPSLSGKKIVIKTFESGAVSGALTNSEAAEAATSAFRGALFGRNGLRILSREDMKTLMQERNMAEMDTESMDDQKLASLGFADVVLSGRVITARQDGSSSAPTGSEVEIEVRATDLKGEMFWRASQRAVSTQRRLLPVVHLGRQPAQPVRELIDAVCKNLASLITGETGDSGNGS